MKRVFLYVIKEVLHVHKNLMLLSAVLLLTIGFFAYTKNEQRTPSDDIVDEWCTECIGMDTEAVRRYFEEKKLAISEMRLQSVADYEKKKLYEDALKSISTTLSTRYDEEVLKSFCSGDDIYVELMKLDNIMDYDKDLYAGLPISDIYNTKYLENYMDLQEYNFLFVLGIIWGCGIWGQYFEFDLRKKEKISPAGNKVFVSRHMLILMLLTIFTLTYLLYEIYVSGVWRIMFNTNNYVRLSNSQELVFANIFSQVLLQSIIKLFNVYFWYFLSFIICNRLRNRTKSLIIVSSIAVILYVIQELNLTEKRQFFIPIGYYKIYYGLLSYSSLFNAQGLYVETVLSVVMVSLIIICMVWSHHSMDGR